MPTYYINNELWADSDATGTATGGGNDYILLKNATSQSDDAFNSWGIYINGGTGAGQSRRIIDYDQTAHGSGERYAQVDAAWGTNPDATSVYEIVKGTDQNDGAAAGVHDGANGAFFSFEKAADTVAADDLVYIKGGRDYITEDGANSCILLATTAGAESTPIIWEGYTTTPGDGSFADATLNAGTNALTAAVSGALSGWYQRFNCLRFTGGTGDGVDLNGAAGDSVHFEGCRFDNNGAWGVQGDNNIIFIGCEIDNNTSGGIDVDTQCHIIGCEIHGNSGNGIVFTTTGHICFNLVYDNGNNTYIQFSGPIAIVNNNSIDGEGEAASIGINQTSAVATNARNEIFNNIIYDCNVGLQGGADQGASNYVDYNLFYSNNTDRTNFDAGSNDVAGSSDPFTNSGTDDYTLKTASEAIAAGLDAGFVVGTSYMDIGAQQKESAAGGSGGLLQGNKRGNKQ